MATNKEVLSSISSSAYILWGKLSHGMYRLRVMCNLDLRCHLSYILCPVLSIGYILLSTGSGMSAAMKLSSGCPVDIQLPRQASDLSSLSCKSLEVVSFNRRESKIRERKKKSNFI